MDILEAARHPTPTQRIRSENFPEKRNVKFKLCYLFQNQVAREKA